MGKYEKLLLEIMNLDKNLRFEELSKVLENMGYISKTPKGGSSHVTFRKKGEYPITIPKGYPISKTYIGLVRDAVIKHESEALDDE